MTSMTSRRGRPPIISFLGPEGTFSQMAAILLFGRDVRYRKEETIGEVFDRVMHRESSFGVVPFENSCEGVVGATLEEMLVTNLYIQRELVLPVKHCLLSRAATFEGVRRVYSHPQALGQCRRWLREKLPSAELVSCDSTAAAASEAARNPEAAAIASRMAGLLQRVPVLCTGIQDRPDNATRFVVVGPQHAPPTGRDKTSLALLCSEVHWSLDCALAVFLLAGIDLYRCHSHPRSRGAWEYVLFVEVEGHRAEPRVARAIEHLVKDHEFVKVLGSYPHFHSAPASAGRAHGSGSA